jgi:hypothetical protein
MHTPDRQVAGTAAASSAGASSRLALRGPPPQPSPDELAAARQFQSIGLEELSRVSLLDRIDTKWFFHRSLVPELLARLGDNYFILEAAGTRIASYDSLYFDTPELTFYRQHHNKQKTRVKVRFRQYVESNLTYAEIKHKTNTGRTAKRCRPSRPSSGRSVRSSCRPTVVSSCSALYQPSGVPSHA